MSTVTISKKEYNDLVEKRVKYEHLCEIMEGDVFSPAPIKDIKKIVKEFDKTKLYNKSFLKSLEKGLKRSDYFGK